MLWLLLLLGGSIGPRAGISTGRAGGLAGITILIAAMALAGESSRSGHGTNTLENDLNILDGGLPLSTIGFELVFLFLKGTDLFFASFSGV